MRQHIAGGAAICSCVMHFFCCVVPLLTTVSGVFSLWGTGLNTLAHPEWMASAENFLPFISAAFLGISAYFTFDKNAKKATSCGCPIRAKKSKRGLRVVFYISCLLFIINIITGLAFPHPH